MYTLFLMGYYNRGNEDLYKTELAYDLRQVYARIVGRNLDNIDTARHEKDYPKYYKGMEDLYTVTKHKFKKVKKADIGKKPTWKELKKEFIITSNKNKEAYIKKTITDAFAVGEIERVLRKIEMWLYFKMDEAGMFGKKEEIEGMF